MIGKTLNHYEVLAQLGVGGMGHVYMAEDTRLHRRVALKVLPSEMAGDADRIERFEREARTIAALNHPNIVTIYSVEEAEGVRFLTMELVDGESLDDRIPFGGLELGEFFDLAVPLASAVAAAHKKGVTHRDIKPANVMVSSEGVVKLLDLGLAKLRPVEEEDDSSATNLQSLTREGRVIGTVPYMAPEQLSAKSSDHRVDIFALGVVLYQMLTGVRPFKGGSSNEVISSILRDQPEPLTGHRALLPEQLGELIHRCLAKSAAQRPQSAGELSTELAKLQRRYESGELVSSARAAAPAAEERRVRTQWLATLSVAVMVAIVAATVFSLLPQDTTATSEAPSDAVLAIRPTREIEIPEPTPLRFPEEAPEPQESPGPVARPPAPTRIEEEDPVTVHREEQTVTAATTSEVSVRLTSEARSGIVTIYADDLQVYRRSFQFAERKGGVLGRLGLKRRVSGELEDSFTVPARTASLRLYVALTGKPARQFVLDSALRGDGSDHLTIEISGAGDIEAGFGSATGGD